MARFRGIPIEGGQSSTGGKFGGIPLEAEQPAPDKNQELTQWHGDVPPYYPEEKPEPPQPTIGDKFNALRETGLMALTGATGGLAGSLEGTAEGIIRSIKEGTFGTQAAADRAEQLAMQRAQQFTYEPRSPLGQRYAGQFGEYAQNLIPLMGVPAAEMTAMTQGVRNIRPMMARTEGPTPASVIQGAVAEAKQHDIPVMTSDIAPPRSFFTNWIQSLGEKIPLAGTGGLRSQQQGRRIAAVRNIVRSFGDEDLAGASDAVMKDLLEKRGGMLTKYADMKNNVIDKIEGVVPMNNTVKAIDAQIARLSKLKTEKVQPVISVLEDFKQSIENQSLSNIEDLRKVLGESFKGSDMSSVRSLGEGTVSSIYGPLREDMGNFIKQNSPSDFRKWDVANKRLANMIGEVKKTSLKSVLSRGDATPELVQKLIFSNKPSEVRLLYRNLSPQGRASARIAILQRAAQKAGGIESISPDKFANEVKRLGDNVGVFFEGGDLQQLKGLVRALEITKRASQASAAPPTGVQVAIPVGAAVLADIFGSSGAAIASSASVGILARMYESAAVRNILIKLSTLRKGSREEAIMYERLASELNKQSEKK